MTAMAADIRAEVIETIIDVMVEADAAGHDPWKAAQARWPSTPVDVIATAWVTFGDRKTEAWWQSIERTIDGEVIKRALDKPE